MTKIITFIIPKGRKQYIRCFLQYQILKRMNHDEYNAIPWTSLFWQHMVITIFFHIHYVLGFPICTFTLYFPCFPFFFYWSHLKTAVVHSSESSLFHKLLIKVQAATAENEEQCTLSNKIYFIFQNSHPLKISLISRWS